MRPQRPATLLFCLLTSCASQEPSFEWFPAAAAAHEPGPSSASRLLQGFDVPGDGELVGEAPVVGDQVLYDLRFESPGGDERWLMLISVEQPEMLVENRTTLRFALHDEHGEFVQATTQTIASRHLSTGLYAVGSYERGEEPSPQRKRELIASVRAMLAFMNAMRRDAVLSELLWKVVRKPSLFSLITNLGVDVQVNIGDSELWTSRLPPQAEYGAAWRVPVVTSINGTQALNSSIVVVEPSRPVSVGAGIVSLVAERPDDSSTRVSMRLLAARRDESHE